MEVTRPFSESKKCQFSTYQNFPPRKSRGNFNEVSSDTPALTVEECARACAQVRRTCNAAIFVPTSFYSDDPLGTCKRYNSVAASVDKIVKMAEKNSPVLIGRVDCQVGKSDRRRANEKSQQMKHCCYSESSLCTYKTSPTVFGSVNDLDIPPDVYYLPRSISHCAQICGESVDCVEVEYEHKFNEYPRCLLFKTSQYPQALSTLHRPDSKEQKQRLTEITCNGNRINRLLS